MQKETQSTKVMSSLKELFKNQEKITTKTLIFKSRVITPVVQDRLNALRRGGYVELVKEETPPFLRWRATDALKSATVDSLVTYYREFCRLRKKKSREMRKKPDVIRVLHIFKSLPRNHLALGFFASRMPDVRLQTIHSVLSQCQKAGLVKCVRTYTKEDARREGVVDTKHYMLWYKRWTATEKLLDLDLLDTLDLAIKEANRLLKKLRNA